MRIVSWNCAGGFAKKAHLLDPLQADVTLIQEISRKHTVDTLRSTAHWLGAETSWKGIAAFTKAPSYVHDCCTDLVPWFMPLVVDDVHILNVWATTTTQNSRRYVRLVHEALDHYQDFLRHPRSILIGDFNSNTVFDGKHAALTHTAMVARLAEVGYSSLYHQTFSEEHGAETSPTFWLYRSQNHPYHLDYAFVSAELATSAKFSLGAKETFLGPSDHIPLIVDIE